MSLTLADELYSAAVGRGERPELYATREGRHAGPTDQLYPPDRPPAVLRGGLYLWGEEEAETDDT